MLVNWVVQLERSMFIGRLSGNLIQYSRTCATNIVSLQSIINVAYDWIPIKKKSDNEKISDWVVSNKIFSPRNYCNVHKHTPSTVAQRESIGDPTLLPIFLYDYRPPSC